MHHPLSAMVGLGFATGFAAAFAITGGALAGRNAGRTLFRAARANRPADPAQLEDAPRRMAQELDHLRAGQQAAPAIGARGNNQRAAVPRVDQGRGQIVRTAALDGDREVDADTRWYQEQMGAEQARAPPIAQGINDEMRDNDLPPFRAQGQVDDNMLVDDEPTPAVRHDPLYAALLDQLLKEAKRAEENRQQVSQTINLNELTLLD